MTCFVCPDPVPLLVPSLVVFNAIGGAIWRRCLGGWLGFRRPYIMAAGALLAWPLWLSFSPIIAAPATALLLVFWSLGHRCDHWTVWLRYGPAAVGYWAALRWWPASWRVGGFIDGWMSVGELVAGAMVWGAVAAVS